MLSLMWNLRAFFHRFDPFVLLSMTNHSRTGSLGNSELCFASGNIEILGKKN